MKPAADTKRFAWARHLGRVGAVLAAMILLVAADLPADWPKDVRDDTPLPTKSGNPAEFAAYTRAILQARRASAEDFAEHVQAGVTGRQMFETERGKYRGQIVRVTGQLKRLQTLRVPLELEKEGISQLFQAWIYDQFSFEKPVAAVFSELPAGLTPAEHFTEAVFVTFDGFFFKRMQYDSIVGPDLTPLVIGRSPRLKESAAPPTIADSGPSVSCPPEWLEHIEDDAPVRSAKENDDEYNAYNYFVLRARQVSPEALAKNARPELTFRRLFEDGRAKYRGEIIHVEGRLKRLNWIGSNAGLEADGVQNLYEAWIFPPEYFSNPTCVIISELPPGVKPEENIQNTWASFDGYFFKRYKYKAVDATRLAPLAIGRTLTVKAPPVSEANSSLFESYARYFVPAGVLLAVCMVALIVTISRWFKSGDRVVRGRLERARTQEFVEPQ